MSILQAEITEKLDAAGNFRVRLPLTDPRTAECQVGRIWRHYREGEGLVFAGQIETVNQQPEDMLEISGPTLLEELLYKNTLLNRQYTNRDLGNVIDDLLSGTGWSRATSLPATRTLSWSSCVYDWTAAGVAIHKAAGDNLSLCNSSSAVGTGGASFSWPHTSSGIDRCLYVAIALRTTPMRTVSTLTYNGVGLTLLGAITQGVQRVELWRLKNPPAGAYTIAVTLSGSAGDAQGGAATWAGVNQTTPEGACATVGGTNSVPSLTVQTPNAGDIALVGLGTCTLAAEPVADQEQTEQLYVPSGSSCLSLCTEPWTITARFDGESILKALLLAVQQPSLHLRENVTEAGGVLSREVEVGRFGESSAITLMGGHPDDVLLDDEHLAALDDPLFIEDTATDIWNWVLPLGGGTGVDQMTLRWCTRNSPYAVQSMAGPDGELVYYLADAASIAAYGQRERAFVAKDIAPLTNTPAALEIAANALYDLAATQLSRFWRNKQTAYRLSVRGLVPSLRPGDTVRLRWRGFAEHVQGGYLYVDVNEELYILERTRRFDREGTEVSELVVSNVDRALQSTDEVIIGKLEDTTRAFRTHVQTNVSNYTSGPVLEELNSSKPMQFDVLIDDNVTQLLRCRLRIKPRAIRSTAIGNSAETAHTHDISGQTAESGGGGTSGGEGTHYHKFGFLGATIGWSDPTYKLPMTLGQISAVGMDVGRQDTLGGTTDLHTDGSATPHAHGISPHSHSVSGATSTAGSSHTHSQTYGIYEDTFATGMTVKVDGVSVAGGPWSAAVTLDITAYLLDSKGIVEQGIHAIEITSTALGRVEAWVDWTVVVQAILAS